jgi:hypothetical protein
MNCELDRGALTGYPQKFRLWRAGAVPQNPYGPGGRFIASPKVAAMVTRLAACYGKSWQGAGTRRRVVCFGLAHVKPRFVSLIVSPNVAVRSLA